MKVSASVMMHPSREHYKPYLQARLGDVPFVMDEGKGVWDTCKRAWREYNPDYKFHVVIQDDAIICDDFYRKAQMIVKNQNLAYNFYFGKRVRSDFLEINAKFLIDGGIYLPGPIWGVAICLPTHLIDEMVEHGDRSSRKPHTDDTRIGDFLYSKGIETYFPCPSLVDHRADSVSLVSDYSGRTALYYIGDTYES